MKTAARFTALFAVLFLFLIQLTGVLVQSIYILDLMNTSLDAKALGLLFFFAPGLLLAFRKKTPAALVWGSFGLLFVARGLTPYLTTNGRMPAAGLGVGSALLLLGLLLPVGLKSGDPRADEADSPTPGWIAAGLALAVALSVLLRSLLFSLDYSLTPGGGWAGWLGGLLLGLLLWLQWNGLDWQPRLAAAQPKRGLAGALLAVFLVLTLIYFAFSAPAVIARWSGVSYPVVVGAVSLLALGWCGLALARPGWAERIPRGVILAWNLLFILSLSGTLLVQRIAFPRQPGEVALALAGLSPLQAAPPAGLLLSWPVLFLDLQLAARRVRRFAPSPARLAPGLLLGSLALVVLVFIHIFTNVWGYIAPFSSPFRNQFWLPYFLPAAGLALLVGLYKTEDAAPAAPRPGFSWAIAAALALIFGASLAGALLPDPAAHIRSSPAPVDPSSLVVMTYNIQAGNDDSAEPAYERQLEIIRQVDPDVLALQESDTARISLNNNDLVRYFAARLGYFAYYGPSPVAGTFGTAILSKYPLRNPAVLYSYSDTDEVGTTLAEIEVSGRTFSLYCVHPDGSDLAMEAFARALLAHAGTRRNVIALGDYNLDKSEAAYGMIAARYSDSWASVSPALVRPGKRDWIDHIFVSPELGVRKPEYLLPPDSATDHPVHWAEVYWVNRPTTSNELQEMPDCPCKISP